MTQAESRTISYAIAGSLAVHVLLGVAFALWVGLSSLHQIIAPPLVEPVEEQPEVTLVFPEPPDLLSVENPPLTEPPKPEMKPYIRTTQNTEAEKPPENPTFESDRNTVAMTKAPPAEGGDPAMPNLDGVDQPTKELANRSFKEGQSKEDSAPAPTPTPAAPLPKPEPPKPEPPQPKPEPPAPAAAPKPEPAPKPPEPEPPAPTETAPEPPKMAKKEDSPAEQKMKELDEKLADQPPVAPPVPEEKTPPPTPAPAPAMRDPDEVPIAKAVPVAEPVVNTPKPKDDAFQPETRVGAMKGGINNIGGEDAVAAEATPAGKYKRKVTAAIEEKWHRLVRARRDVVEPGYLQLRFYVTKDGSIAEPQFLQKQATPLLEDLTLEAILTAEIPPLPADLVPMLNKGRLEMSYNIVISPK